MAELQHCAGCRDYTRDWISVCPGLTLEEFLMRFARDSLDGGQISPEDQRVLAAFSETLGHRVTKPGLHWREWRENPGSAGFRHETPGSPGFWQEWYCEPPRLGQFYRVNPGCDLWLTEDGQPVRRIYEIEEIPDAATHSTAAIAAGARPDRAGPARPGASRAGTGAAGTPAEAEAGNPPQRAGGTGGPAGPEGVPG